MSTESLCLALANCNEGQEIRDVLTKAGYWDDANCWENFADNPNNWSQIGNQQSQAINALVEKFVNSGDAVLTAKCREAGIDPNDFNAAPKSSKQAMVDFLKVPDGDISQLDKGQRAKLAKECGGVVSSGRKDRPTYTVFDYGEGQAPEKFKDTFLALSRSNKTGIAFVQGKHCSGSTGALPFCEEGLQLIISRRNPNFKDKCSSDVGFTVLRKFPPTTSNKNYTLKYLTINGDVPSFPFTAPLAILPREKETNPCVADWHYGAFVKMFDFDIGKSLRSAGNLDLVYKLSILLPNPTFPLRFYERRAVKANSPEINMNGLLTRLQDDRGNNIEPNTPFAGLFSVQGQNFKYQIYVLNSSINAGEINTRWQGDNGLIFTLNGQANGFVSRAFYRRKTVRLDYLENKIITIVDCSDLDNKSICDLFMNDRQNLRQGPLYREVESELEAILRDHQGLRQILDQHRQQNIKNRVANKQPAEEVVSKMLRSNPVLNKIFIQGQRLSNPWNMSNNQQATPHQPNFYPTYFKLDKKSSTFSQTSPRKIEEKRSARIGLVTDAPNDYFTRTRDCGTLSVSVDGIPMVSLPTLLGNDGAWILNLNLPQSQVGQKHEITIEISDPTQVQPFTESFWVEVVPYRQHTPGKTKTKTKKTPTNNLSLPDIIEIRQPDWPQQNFDRNSALKIVSSGQNSYDYFINMDNVHLLHEIKNAKQTERDVVENQYKLGMFLIGMSLAHEHASGSSSIADIATQSQKISKYLSQMLVPMIRELGSIGD